MTLYQVLHLMVLCVSAGILCWQIRLIRKGQRSSYELQKRVKAFELIDKYNSPEFSELRTKIRSEEFSEDGLVPLLNFFEQVAISVHNDIGDEELCKKFFDSLFSLWLKKEKVIKFLESAEKEDPRCFIYFRELNTKWSAETKAKPTDTSRDIQK